MKAIIKHRLYFYAAILLLMAGCKLDKPSYANFFATANSYQPVTKGSYWVYQTLTNAIVDTITTTMTGYSSVINGRTSYEATTTYLSGLTPIQTSEFSDDNHAFTQLSLSTADTLNTYYFNDTTAVNGTWIAKANNSGYIGSNAARFAGQIVEKNISKVINGQTFVNVIHTKIYLQFDNGSGTGYVTVAAYDYFIAKGIGIIEIDSSSSGTSSTQTIVSYSIKTS